MFTSVNEANVLSKSTFAAFVDLMDNYKSDAKVVEDHTEAEKAEESKFLDLILETDVMQEAFKFMVEKGWSIYFITVKAKLFPGLKKSQVLVWLKPGQSSKGT